MRNVRYDFVKLVLILAASLGLVLVVVQNCASVRVRFLWFKAEAPALLLLFLNAMGGFVVGLFVALFVKSGEKSKS
ncbi:MAG: hypothetical protein JW699_05810 [Chitinispirillaceae bacterium]|nr:hypothetical protein [Chitinispirillaceae bacterium]